MKGKYIVRFDKYNGSGVHPDPEPPDIEADTLSEARVAAEAYCAKVSDGDETDGPLCAEDDRPAGDWCCGREIGGDGWVQAWIETPSDT